jgi:hypothetical protein
MCPEGGSRQVSATLVGRAARKLGSDRGYTGHVPDIVDPALVTRRRNKTASGVAGTGKVNRPPASAGYRAAI